MIETEEQYEQAEEAVAKLKKFFLAAKRTHTAEAYTALSVPILRELQERERDILISLSHTPDVAAGSTES